MAAELPEKVRGWLDGKAFASFATIEPDGRPQLSAVWVKRDGDDILISTVLGRRKHRNLERDARAGLLVVAAEDPYEFVEVRGDVQMTVTGGRELIDELSEKYNGLRPYPNDAPEAVRVVLRLTPDRVRFRG